MIKRVTLSDGTRVPVALPEYGPGRYYPDRPHCTVCDRRAPEVELRPCTTLPYHGTHRNKPCGRWLCTDCGHAEGHARVRCISSGTDRLAHCPYAW